MVATRALNLFDRLHLGHRLLIDRLAESETPIATITDGELVGDLELGEIIQPVQHREKRLKEYLHQNDLDKIRVEIVDKYSTLLNVDENLQLLMYIGPCCDEISSHLLGKRKALGFEDELEYLKPVMAQDGEKLTSARLRKGELDREGGILARTDEPPRRLKFSDRTTLQTPKGEVFHVNDGPPEKRVAERIRSEKDTLVIAVGDVTCATLEKQGVIPKVRIVDGITKRGEYEHHFAGERVYHVYNPPAVLYPEVWSTISTAIKNEKNSLIVVDGEEDLMGFPAVLLAPEGSVMIYGQPDVGIVWVPVTNENRILARKLLENMPVITDSLDS